MAGTLVMREWLVVADLNVDMTPEIMASLKKQFNFDTPDPKTVVGTVLHSSVGLAGCDFMLKVGVATKSGGWETAPTDTVFPTSIEIVNMRVMQGVVVDTKTDRGRVRA